MQSRIGTAEALAPCGVTHDARQQPSRDGVQIVPGRSKHGTPRRQENGKRLFLFDLEGFEPVRQCGVDRDPDRERSPGLSGLLICGLL